MPAAAKQLYGGEWIAKSTVHSNRTYFHGGNGHYGVLGAREKWIKRLKIYFAPEDLCLPHGY